MAGEGNPVSIQDFFKFDDTQGLDQFIEKIQKLDGFYDTLVSTAKKGASDISSSMQTIQKSIEGLEKTMVDADTTTKKGQDTIAKGAQQSSALIEENEKYKKALKELEDQIKVLITQQDKLTDSKEKLNKIVDTETGSVNDLKKQLKEATDYYNNLGKAVDSSVKQDAIKRITDLNKAVQDGNKIVSDAKKATDVAAGSYNELAQKVTAATKQLKAFEGGVGTTSKEFKDLQKFVADGNVKLKEFDASIGNHQRNVGDYKLAVEGLKSNFEGLLGTLGPAGEKIEEVGSKAIGAGRILLGVGSGLAGIAVAAAAVVSASLGAYFTRTAAGAKELFEATSRLEYEYELFLTALSRTGGFLVDLAKQSELGRVAQVALALATDESAKAFERNALRGRQLIRDRIALTTEESKLELEKNALLFDARNKLEHTDEERLAFNEEAYAIQVKISNDAVKQAQAELTQRTREILEKNKERDITKLGAKELAELNELEVKVNEARKQRFDGTRRIQAQRIQISEEIHKREIDLEKEDLTATIGTNNAIVQADQQKNSAILANLKSSQEERRAAIEKNAQDEKQLAANAREQALADAKQKASERIRASVGAANFDAVPEQQEFVINHDRVLAEQRIEIEKQYANKIAAIDIKSTQDKIANDNDFLKRKTDNYIKQYNSLKDIEAADLNLIISTNETIAKSELVDLDKRLDAESEISKAKINLLKITRDKAIELATSETEKKIAIEGNEAVNRGLLNDQIAKLNSDFDASEIKELKSKLAEDVNIITDYYNNRIAIQSNFNQQELNAELISLNERFKQGKVSLLTYGVDRQILNNSFAEKEYKNREKEYTEELKALKVSYDAKLITQETYIQKSNELDLKKSNNDKNESDRIAALRLKGQTELNAKLIQLETELATAVQAVGDNLFQAQQDKITARIQDLTDQKNTELTLAGDNANGKIAIEKVYAAKIAEENKKLKKSKHDQAIFDRDVALVQVQIEAAKAIAATLYLFATPATVAIGAALDIIIGTIALAQTAAILSKPIPAYSKGRRSGPAEMAIVSEAGPEMVVERSGKATLYDTPGAALVHLKADSSVLTAQETQKVMDSAEFSGSLSRGPGMPVLQPVVVVHSDPKLLAAVQANRPIEGIRQGLEWYKLFRDKEGNRKLNRSYIGNFD